LRISLLTQQTMLGFIVYACIASLLSGASSEGLDSDPVEDGILYVGRNMLARVRQQLERNEEVTHEVMSKLLGFVPDEEIMTPVDVNGVDVDFVSIDVWLRDLGARGTAKALVKAAHFYKQSKSKGTETQTPQFVGTLMLEQTRDKLAVDEEVTDEDVAKMLGFLPDERSFVALDLSQHGHDLSDIDAWLSKQGLKGAAEACVAAALPDFSIDTSSVSILPQDMNATDSDSILESQTEQEYDLEALEEEAAEEETEEAAEEETEDGVEEPEEAASVEYYQETEEDGMEEPEEAASVEYYQETEAVAEEEEYVEASDSAEVNLTDDSESDVPIAADTAPQRVRWCALNLGCEQFQGLCCPDTRGRMLPCCAIAEQSPPPAPHTKPAAPWADEDGVYFPKFAGSRR